MATSITVSDALDYENGTKPIPPNTTFQIIDTAENIETLSAGQISGLSSLGVTFMIATDGPATFPAGGAQQHALVNAGISITAHVSVQEAVALDTETNMSGGPVLVPPGENLFVVDTAANLELLSPTQIKDLGTAVDTATASGGDSGSSAVMWIAATDAPAVFKTDQVQALRNASIAIVAPPLDPGQNDGTAVVSGRGITFDITWDASVASAPAAYKTDVEEAFQFIGDTYSAPVTFYFDVGYGETDGTSLGPSDLGSNEPNGTPSESYATLVGQLKTEATSQAQLDAVSTLPSTDPTGVATFDLTPAQAQTLGVAGVGTSSASDPDGYLGFSSGDFWNYDADPNQTPVVGEYDFVSTVEHELTEELGRISDIDNTTSQTASDAYSLIDLYRFSAADTRALSSFDNPSYFSIDNGTTDLSDWNNYTQDNTGDLADWSINNKPDSFNDEGSSNVINPFSPTDATLINVLGFNFTNAPDSPIALPSTDTTLSVGQLLEDLTLNKIDPGSVNAPNGTSYVVIDTPFAIESLTATEMKNALSIGVSEFIVDGGIAFLQGSSDPKNDQITALGATPFLAVLTVADAQALEANPPTVPANETVMIVDTAANIETLTASDISALPSIGVSSITATDAPVTFTPGGPEQAALKDTGISITAYISASEAIALDVEHHMSGSPVLVPQGEQLIVLDTAANLEGLTTHQLSDLGSAVDTVDANGVNTGNSAIINIAATDAPAVFTPNQVVSLATSGITVVAPPNDPNQNDGTTTIHGRGITFDITWDSSVASAPAEFKTDVEEVFQMFADTYSSPATLYYHVGYGEDGGNPVGPGFLGRSLFYTSPSESYASLVSQLKADATSPAQLAALSTLPATDPATKVIDYLSQAQAQTLGFANAGTSSADNPDGYIGFSSDTAWNYSADPNQTPVAGESDFIGSVEHELTEILGRLSFLGDAKHGGFTDQSLLDLYRFSGANTRALSKSTDPSYFSIDNGVTDLGDWNNRTTGDTGDLGDWSGTNVNGTVEHTPDAFNDDSDSGIINPFTATDATLMNVLGYNFAAAPASPIPLASSDITLSSGQLLMDLTLDEINPGSVNPPAGDSYVVVDTAFDIESLTASEITQALSIGVSEFIVDGSIAFLQAIDPANDQISALGNTPFIAVLTEAEALAAEAAANQPFPPQLPPNESVIVADTAANIELLSPSQVVALASIGASELDVSDLSGASPLIIQNNDTYVVHGAVTSDETIQFDYPGGRLVFDDTPDMKGTISGFEPHNQFNHDEIVLSDVAFDPHGSVNLLAGNVLEVTENGATYDLQLNPSQHDFAGEFFHLHADHAGGTDIVENRTPCYCPGTLIQTPHGETPVENLAIGDLVMTRAGVARPIKWIGRRGFAGRFVLGRKDILPVCIKAGALGDNVPRRDLWISPHHAMYFQSDFLAGKSADAACRDGVLIEAKDLINGSTIVQAERVETIEYFHIELDAHDVIAAEGAWSESFLDDDSRGMFHNAQEFHALYPSAASAGHYCAPRLDAGYEVEAVRQAIAQRAGLLVSAASPGAVRGSIDAIGADAIEGWAQNDNEPEAPVCLDIFIGGRRAGQALANRFREDLAAAGIGRGYHAFRFELPQGLTIGNAAVDVRRSLDGKRFG